MQSNQIQIAIHPDRKKKGFSFQGSYVFLTYPQCPLSPDEILAKLQARIQLKAWVIGQELHVDGSPHAHALLGFLSKLHTTSERYFDLETFHPNIAKASSAADRKRISRYCKKGGKYIQQGFEDESHRALLFKELLQSGLTPAFVRQNPEIMALPFANLQRWLHFVSPPQIKHQELPKRRHVWLHGPANTGKSFYLRRLLELYSSHQEIPVNGDYSHCDDRTDCLWIDEYRGQLTVQALNRLCDGYCRLNTKGGATFVGYPRVVVVSNYSVEEVYSKVPQNILDTLYARFQIYLAPIYPKFPTCEL